MAVFKIVHVTKYEYSWPIKESINEIRLFPHDFENQDVLQFQLKINTNPNIEISSDYYGNRMGNFNTLDAHKELILESNMLVRVHHTLKIPEIETTTVADLSKEMEKSILLQRLCYPEIIKNQKKIDKILSKIMQPNKSIVTIAQECNEYIFKNFIYTKGITTIYTTLDEILEIKKGVCQDFAHLLLQLLRTAGIPSRYVSGYICPNENDYRGEGATHAWVEIFTPNQGWLGLDPTNNIWTMANHVKLSVGRNFNDCTPVKGTFKGLSRQTLSVSVAIGYEDGTQYQEINDVQLEETTEEEKVQLDYIDQMYQQQQQQ
jgi:transglutaminase-like putative cysteine protease